MKEKKRKTIKRVVCLLLGMSMTIGMLMGCGKGSSGDGSKVNGTVGDAANYEYKTGFTITMGGKQGATPDWQSSDVVEKLEELFEFSIDCQPFADNDFSTKFSVQMADDDLYDLYVACTHDMATISQWGADGYLLALDEYLDYMPNLAAYFKQYPEYQMACTSEDGHIYSLTVNAENPYERLPYNFMRTDWLENLGLEMPTTVDELYDVLVAFKEQDANGNGDPNDEVPLVFSEGYNRKTHAVLLDAFGIHVQSNTSEVYNILQVDEDGKVYLADTTENYKAFLKYMNKLYKEELLYNDTTVSISTIRQWCSENKVGICSGTTFSDNYEDYAWFAGFTSEYNDTRQSHISHEASAGGKLLISATTEYAREICRMIDWFFSDEGAFYGKDGDVDEYNVEYEELKFNGYEEFEIKDIITPPAEEYGSWDVQRYKERVINNGFDWRGVVTDGAGQAILNGSHKKEDLWQFVEAGLRGDWALMQIGLNDIEAVEGYPVLAYPSEVLDERASLVTDINSYCRTMYAQFLTGEKNIDANWDTFVSTLESMGLSRLLEIEQETYDEYYK